MAPAECAAVLVGFDADTSSVEMIWVRRDGVLVLGERTHLLTPGRTAVGEGITTFGLTRLRRFPATDFDKAQAYARRLAKERDDDAPRIL